MGTGNTTGLLRSSTRHYGKPSGLADKQAVEPTGAAAGLTQIQWVRLRNQLGGGLGMRHSPPPTTTPLALRACGRELLVVQELETPSDVSTPDLLESSCGSLRGGSDR